MAAAVTVGGCLGNLFAVEGVSAVLTDKTASDHAVSFLSGKDCSFLRVENNKSYCVEDANIANQSHLYCYPTIGTITCYNEPDPRRSPDERIGFIDKSVNKK